MNRVGYLLLVLICLMNQIYSEQDYYKVLELDRDATQQEIKQAFRQLSKQYHPDRHPGDQDKAQHFVDINTAYEVLSDQEKRQIYDLHGHQGLSQEHQQQQDIFGFNRHTGLNKGPDANADIPVTLQELYTGTTREFTIKKNILCPICRGTGSKDGKLKTCTKCNGHGIRIENMQTGMGFTMQMQVTCERCQGKGKITQGNCQKCHGKKVQQETKVLNIVIEKGMKDGQHIVFKGESEQSPDHLPGDVVFHLKQQPHNIYTRIGNNLFRDLHLTLEESLLGFTKVIKQLDDRQLKVSSQEVVQPFQVKVLYGEGMVDHQTHLRGDMHIKYIVNLPTNINNQQKQIINQAFTQ